MTAAERQRRRRAKLRTENPPQKPGRPRLGWLEASTLEKFTKLTDGNWRSARRHDANRCFENFGKQVLQIDPRFPDNYSSEDAKRFEPLARSKCILEQLGRHLVFVMNVLGCDADEAKADTRELAEGLIDEGKLNVVEVVRFFRWFREGADDTLRAMNDQRQPDAVCDAD